MRVLVDVSLSIHLATALATEGHDCQHANHIGLRSKPDRIVFAEAQSRDSILLSREGNTVIIEPDRTRIRRKDK